ncbi:OPRD protein, partial [Smithornis capensis]|nr:OPRD protein [Smithornis capensis]
MELTTALPSVLPSATPTLWDNGTAWAPLPGHGVNDTDPARGKNATSILIAIVITALYSVVCVVGLLGNVLVMYGILAHTKIHSSSVETPALGCRESSGHAEEVDRSRWKVACVLHGGWEETTWEDLQGTGHCTHCIPSASHGQVAQSSWGTFAKSWQVGMCLLGVLTQEHLTCPESRVPTSDTPPPPSLTLLSPTDGMVLCTLQFPDPPIYWDTVTKICVFIFAFLVPILVITICYGLMILRLKSVRLLSGSKEKDRNLRRITRMVLVVVAAFIICWTPIHIFVIVWTLVDIDKKNPYVVASLHFCIALGYTNSSLNPVLYAFLDENFKRCFREFCLPFRARVDQNSFSRARNTTRERVSTCTPSEARNKPA